MKRKIVGVLIALCMVCVFVGCADPVNEKPGENSDAIYKDSAFVGTWVCIVKEDDGIGYESWVMKYTYTLTEDGKGTWTGIHLTEDGNEPADRSIVWAPLANGEVELYETWMTSSLMDDTNIAALSDDGLTLSLGSMKYEKVSDDSTINYKDSGFVGTWTYEEKKNGVNWEYTYIFNDNGKGKWSDSGTPDDPDDGPVDLSDSHEIFWFPHLNGEVTLVEVWTPYLYQFFVIRSGALVEGNEKLAVGSTSYTKQP